MYLFHVCFTGLHFVSCETILAPRLTFAFMQIQLSCKPHANTAVMQTACKYNAASGSSHYMSGNFHRTISIEQHVLKHVYWVRHCLALSANIFQQNC